MIIHKCNGKYVCDNEIITKSDLLKRVRDLEDSEFVIDVKEIRTRVSEDQYKTEYSAFGVTCCNIGLQVFGRTMPIKVIKSKTVDIEFGEWLKSRDLEIKYTKIGKRIKAVCGDIKITVDTEAEGRKYMAMQFKGEHFWYGLQDQKL